MEPHKMAEKSREKAPGTFSLLGTASTMGLHMVSGPVVGGGLGWLVDNWLDSWPVAASVGLVLGLAAGFRNVWADARYLEHSNAVLDAERKKQEESAQSASGKSVSVKKKESLSATSAPSLTKSKERAEPENERPFSGETEREAASDAFTASVLAGTASPEEKDLEELDETVEAIRRALEEQGQKGHGHSAAEKAGKGQA